jgi:hypothetical protein
MSKRYQETNPIYDLLKVLFMPKSIILGGQEERRLEDELERDAVCHRFYSTRIANTFWSGDFKHGK